MARWDVRGALLLALISAAVPSACRAEEAREIRIAQQYGLPFLPLTVMKERRLLEQAMGAAGLPEPKVSWAQFANGTVMNESLSSGTLVIAPGGILQRVGNE